MVDLFSQGLFTNNCQIKQAKEKLSCQLSKNIFVLSYLILFQNFRDSHSGFVINFSAGRTLCKIAITALAFDEMETCIRGFSFMPETKVEVPDLKYIESGELERTWRSSRRQRLKDQEQRVWEEFVKEQDVVKVVCKDDPYQFLHQLPESCLKELMEAELQKTRIEFEHELKIEQPNQGEGDFHQKDEVQHSVTFADDGEKDDCDMFHIFDDDKDDPSGPSGPEDETINDSMGSPSTVRGRDSENVSPPPLYEKGDPSAENVSNVIESSIYCAKVKDLRLKIRDEITSIMASLEQQDVMTIEREAVSRMCRRSAEFSARFNRIYMYQLQRQMEDLKRNTLHSLPFAKHTYFHAQMVRVASLHHNLLQAFQVFHKSVCQTACVRQSAALLHALAQSARAVSVLGADVPPPAGLHAAATLYNDEMLAACDKLDEAVCEHSLRVTDFLSTTENTSRSTSRKAKGKGKRRMHGPLSKTTKSMTDTEARLSMYSLDTLRPNPNGKPGKELSSSGTSKVRVPLSGAGSKSRGKNEGQPKSPKRSPRSRRPLMRAGAQGAQRTRARAACCKDTEITTMVEAVETCTSSRMSREPSPHRGTPRRRTPSSTPRTHACNTPRKSLTTTPRQKLRPLSPKAKIRRSSPKQSQIIRALSSIKSDPQDTEGSIIQVTPVSKIKCAKKDMSVGKNFDKPPAKDKVNKTDKICEKPSAQDPPNDSICNVNSKTNDSTKDFDSFKEFDSGRDFDSRKDFDSGKETATSSKETPVKVMDPPENSAREERDGGKSDRDRNKSSRPAPAARCEVTRLLKHLCSGDGSGSRNEKVSGAKNAQLLCVSGGSPRQPSTPQLLRILEETIQKKIPRPMYPKPSSKDPERFRMTFNIPDRTADSIFQYRTKFVQHMLASSMYANSVVGKPWEMIGSVSEKIIDELLTGCAREMQLQNVLEELYNCETK